ncbi:MAG: ATP-binding protein [Patescibacteria group bacterium]
MGTLLFILGTIFVMFLVAAPIVFLQTRKTFREQKNYERGLKMVPLLIHLPPPSDDTEIGNRDARDVTDETISKAQLIYDIIASTLLKDFKSSFYGQRHFAFEIVGSQGFVYFYAAVPLALLDIVKQAINSAYPSARLEEVNEHNIFSPVGRVSGTMGGELTLKEPFAYPIATYQDLKRDSMQSLLNALATLGKEDGAGIQILIRPAHPSWRKTAQDLASKKRKGGGGGLGGGEMAKSLAVAFVKPPEGGGDDGPKKPDLSNMEQSVLDAIDEKTRHAGYEVVIRLVASSNISQRAQAILTNIVGSFQLYDSPGKNGFKYTPAKDIDGLITSYIMRFFPQEHNKNILNSVELATLFHFPDESNIPTSQLARQDSKQVDGPRNVPEDGLLLGYNLFRGAKKPIRLGLGDRQRHMYVVGQTGTGKSTFLENVALQDMLSGNGFAFVDPHGDVVERLLSMVPKERTEDIIYFSPSDMDYPMGLNLFEFNTPDQKDFLIQESLNMLQKLYDPQQQGIMGPRYEHIFRNAALAIMSDPEGGTFVDVPKLFRDPRFLQKKLQHVTDVNVRDFWLKEYPSSQRSNDAGEVNSWFVSKFGAFLSNEMMRNIIGQTKSAFDLRDIMDNKKILLVNLSKGRTGELNSKLLGMVFVMKFQAAAMSRSDIPEEERIDFSLYVDEFQNFSTDSFATIMSEARKYHLNLIVANQFTTQLTTEIRDAVFGNIGTIVSFRIGQNDVESLGQYFQPTFDSDDLLRIPNYNTIVRTLINGVPTQPFSMATLPALGTPNMRLSLALKQLSAAKYGRPKAVVDKEITERMTKSDGLPLAAAPASGAARPTAASQAAAPVAAPTPAPAKSGSSFLDEWLHKRKTGVVSSAPTLSPAPAAAPASPTTAPTIDKHQSRTALQEPSQVDEDAPSTQPYRSGAGNEPTPVLGAPIVAPQAQPADDSKTNNISSNELEQSEVHQIAAQLKQDLDTPEAAVQPEEPVIKKTEHIADLESEEGDTIVIGRDGTFQQAANKDKKTS